MKDEFIKMIEKMDMSYSYKPVLLLAMLDYADKKGKVKVNDLEKEYSREGINSKIQAVKRKTLFKCDR